MDLLPQRRLTKAAVAERVRISRPPDKESDGTEKLMTSREVAARLKVTLQTLNMRRSVGSIPFIRISRHEIRYRWSEIITSFETQRVCQAKPVFRVFDFKGNGRVKFKVEGLVKGERVRKYFARFDAANEFARKQNN